MIDFPASPTTGQIFTAAGASWRYDGTKWVAYGVGSSNDVGRNLLHNALMAVAQRASGPWTATGSYTADRWRIMINLDSDSVTRAAITDAERTAIGDEAASICINNVFTGTGTAGAYSFLYQSIEGVRPLAGKTITVSFWAWATAAGLKLGFGVNQNFGTGGSPSAQVGIAGQAATLSTAPTRFSLTFSLPSITGKTLGTNSDDNTALNCWFSSGATYSVASGGVGVQSGTVRLWGVQLEIGSVMTPLEKVDLQQDFAKCQRFYQTYTGVICSAGYALAGAAPFSDFTFVVPFRAAPSIAFSNQNYTNASGLAVNAVVSNHLRLTITVTATGLGWGYGDIAASADL